MIDDMNNNNTILCSIMAANLYDHHNDCVKFNLMIVVR